MTASLTSARFEYEILSYLFFAAGSVVLFLVSYLVYMNAIRPAKTASRQVEENKALLNSVQEAALLLAEMISILNDHALLHVDKLSEATSEIVSKLSGIPLVGQLVPVEKITGARDDLAKSIRTIAAGSRGVVQDVASAISKSDPKLLSKYVKDLREAHTRLEDIFL